MGSMERAKAITPEPERGERTRVDIKWGEK